MNTAHAKHQLSRLSEMVEGIERMQGEIKRHKERLKLPLTDNQKVFYEDGEIEKLITDSEADLKILESDYYTKLANLTSQAYKDIVEVKS